MNALRERLPKYMVPHQVLVKSSLPQNSHGKRDSFDMISIIEAVMEELEVDIPVEGINEENFDSLRKMERFISKLQTSR